MKLEVLGQTGGKIHDPRIEKWRPNFQRVRHAHAIHFVKDVVRKVVSLVEIKKALQSTPFHFSQPASQSILASEQIHGPLFALGMRAVPKTMRQLRRKQTAFQESLELVFKTDAAILDRQLHGARKR
jgi:hypothetical protein